MIVVTQIKAARALLGWTQSDLAKAANLSLPAVNNIERSLSSPRKVTLEALEIALTKGGVEFIDNIGVQLRQVELNIQTIEGPDWLKRYDEVIISQMNGSDDEIVQFSCDEKMWMVHGSTSNHHYFDHRDKVNFKERILVPKSQDFITNLQRVYRYHDDTLFGKVSWQVFGPYVSQILWVKGMVILVRSQTMADAQRAIFEELWKGGKPYTDEQWRKLKKWYPPESLL